MSARPVFPLLILMMGCASYVAPRTVPIDPATYDESRLIPYRTLVPADFKATCAPRELEATSIGAVTAALLRTSSCSITTYKQGGASVGYVAVIDDLWFEARMSQNHSWWNATRARNDALLLEHEQTHFAFAELGARDANARLEQIEQRIRSVASTEAEAVSFARARLQSEVDRIQAAVAARNEEFDHDTLNGQRRERSHRWFEQIQDELRESEGIAADPAHRTRPSLPATSLATIVGPSTTD